MKNKLNASIPTPTSKSLGLLLAVLIFLPTVVNADPCQTNLLELLKSSEKTTEQILDSIENFKPENLHEIEEIVSKAHFEEPPEFSFQKPLFKKLVRRLFRITAKEDLDSFLVVYSQLPFQEQLTATKKITTEIVQWLNENMVSSAPDVVKKIADRIDIKTKDLLAFRNDWSDLIRQNPESLVAYIITNMREVGETLASENQKKVKTTSKTNFEDFNFIKELKFLHRAVADYFSDDLKIKKEDTALVLQSIKGDTIERRVAHVEKIKARLRNYFKLDLTLSNWRLVSQTAGLLAVSISEFVASKKAWDELTSKLGEADSYIYENLIAIDLTFIEKVKELTDGKFSKKKRLFLSDPLKEQTYTKFITWAYTTLHKKNPDRETIKIWIDLLMQNRLKPKDILPRFIQADDFLEAWTWDDSRDDDSRFIRDIYEALIGSRPPQDTVDFFLKSYIVRRRTYARRIIKLPEFEKAHPELNLK